MQSKVIQRNLLNWKNKNKNKTGKEKYGCISVYQRSKYYLNSPLLLFLIKNFLFYLPPVKHPHPMNPCPISNMLIVTIYIIYKASEETRLSITMVIKINYLIQFPPLWYLMKINEANKISDICDIFIRFLH